MANKAVTFIKEARVELKKVNWPTKQQTINYTLIVIGLSIGVALFLGGLDFIFSEVLKKLIG